MSESNTTYHGKVPFGQKVAFGLGMLANQMFPAVLGIFMVVLVQDLKFPGWMWGILFFLPRIFDSITDPIMGFISDNTRSIWGRRRQYVFVGAIILGLSFIMMWQLYREDGIDYNFYYFLLWSFVFYLGLTIFSVPYVAMGYEMSDDFHERTNIMAVAQWIGQWAWVIAPWFWVIMYDQDLFPNADSAVRTIAVWVSIACMLLAMVPAVFIKSRSTKNDTHLEPLSLKNIGGSLTEIFKGFAEAFESIPFRRLCVSTFLIFNAFNTIAGFSFFIIVWYLFNGDAQAANAGFWPTLFGSVGAIVTTFVVIPIVASLSKKLGKKKAFLVSQAISIVGYIMLWFLFVPGKPYLFLIALPFFSFGIGSLFTLMMSMTADVIDLDELKTGKRREGIFGAIYWWMVKFGLAIAGLLSGVIMSVVGFDPNAATQSEEAITGLRLFFSGLPVLGTSIAMYIIKDYSLDEEKVLEIQDELRIKKEQPSLATLYYQHKKGRHLFGEEQLTSPITLPDYAKFNDEDYTKNFRTYLENGVYGICFSPYTESQGIEDTLTYEQIDRRMQVIAPYTKWVRSFSCTKGNEMIAEIAKKYGLKTMVGAWIGKDKTENEIEIQNLITLCKKGVLDIAAVGNEVLLRNELSETEVIAYLDHVKQEVENVPVGYVDAYFQFIERPALVNHSDIILINCYPFWEGVTISQSLAYLNQMYQATLKVSQGKKVIITETGWPNEGSASEEAIPTNNNTMQYFINTAKWSQEKNIPYFYFSSFDESWKVHHEGDVGARWGIWDKNSKLKY